MKAIVISGFPGVGKTYYYDEAMNVGANVLDSDSSSFSWITIGGEKTRNPEFPKNYMHYVKEQLTHVKLILVSSHREVRKALFDQGIHFMLVYPDISLKDEYLQKFKDRGNSHSFITFISENWESFIKDIEAQKGCDLIKLKSGQFLTSVL